MPSGIFQILPGLLAGPPETDEIHDPPAVPVQQHHPVAGARQRPGAVHHTPQHRVEIEAVVDPQAGLDQPRQPVPQIPHAAQANAPQPAAADKPSKSVENSHLDRRTKPRKSQAHHVGAAPQAPEPPGLPGAGPHTSARRSAEAATVRQTRLLDAFPNRERGPAVAAPGTTSTAKAVSATARHAELPVKPSGASASVYQIHNVAPELSRTTPRHEDFLMVDAPEIRLSRTRNAGEADTPTRPGRFTAWSSPAACCAPSHSRIPPNRGDRPRAGCSSHVWTHRRCGGRGRLGVIPPGGTKSQNRPDRL